MVSVNFDIKLANNKFIKLQSNILAYINFISTKKLVLINVKI